MLQQLSIKNYAIIDSVQLDFSSGLNIITGETGAGKSILLGALKLILGERADVKALFNTDRKCIIEGTFDIGALNMRAFFQQHDLDYEEPLIVRREILPSGKSRAFVNDTPVTLAPLKELGIRLVEMHQQFDTVSLFQEEFQRDLLDLTGGTEGLYRDYLTAFQQFQAKKRQTERLKTQLQSAQKEQSFLEFQLQELTEFNPVAGEEDSLMQELKALENAREIIRTLTQIHFDANESEQSLLDSLRQHERLLSNIAPYVRELPDLLKRLEAVVVELDDIYDQLGSIHSGIYENPEALQELNDRYDRLQTLLRKHGVVTSQQLLSLKDELETKLSNLSTDSMQLEELEAEVERLHAVAQQKAGVLSKARAKAWPNVSDSLQKMLKKLGMPEAKVRFDLTPTESLTPLGMEHVSLLFSANKGIAPRPIREIASGGELSRLNLCIKSLIADKAYLPTLVFDEIDTGISGEIAKHLGQMLYDLARKHQVISITHAPIVAAFGDKHFEVFKDHSGNKTTSGIKVLEEQERIIELAKMISGNPPSTAAINNAKELVERK